MSDFDRMVAMLEVGRISVDKGRASAPLNLDPELLADMGKALDVLDDVLRRLIGE